MKVLFTTAATLAIVASAGATALAENYSGDWPVTVSHAPRGDGTYCLMLTDNRSGGWPHSGPASLVAPSGKFPYGTFQVIDDVLVATIQQPGGSQNAALLFIAPAKKGSIGNGSFEQVYGGEDSDSGELAVGTKGGC